MLKQIFKTAWAVTLAVFYFSNPALASDQNNSDCMELFNQVQEAYSKSNFEATVIESNPMALELYSLCLKPFIVRWISTRTMQRPPKCLIEI